MEQSTHYSTTQNAVQRQRYKRSIVEGNNVVVQILDCWPTTNMIASFTQASYYMRAQGKTQLFRAKCNNEQAQQIFFTKNEKESTTARMQNTNEAVR